MLELALILGAALADMNALAVLLAVDPLSSVLRSVGLPVDRVTMQATGRPLTLVGCSIRPDLDAIAVPGVAHPVPVVRRPARHLHGRAALGGALGDELPPPVLEEVVCVLRERLLRRAQRLVHLVGEPLITSLQLLNRPAHGVQLRMLSGRLFFFFFFFELPVGFELALSDSLYGLIVEDTFQGGSRSVLIEDMDDGTKAERLVRGG
mmetsp:Transcript_86123/g.252004  ORF Transcript_86123/g.252004 Transcript_86123/m.252004 type:complete len:207 (+) Transcript_86123:533-1153(+)